MTKLQEKAQAQVKQMVGQIVGDDELIQEGREQQQKADESERTASVDPAKEKEGRAKPAGPRSEQKR